MTYEKARGFAAQFLTALNNDSAMQDELLAAITECFHRYDTGAYENRFIVGAVVEQLLGATARALGFEVENAGAHRQAYDLEIGPNYGLSVKYSSSTGRSARVRITNSQGAVGVWTTGTIFVLAGVGIGYADAGLVPGATVHAGDMKSLDVAVQPLLQLWQRPLAVTKGPAPTWLSGSTQPTVVAGL